MIWTLPNILTTARILAAPLLAVVLWLIPGGWGAALAFVLFVAASATDYLDGYLARKSNQISRFGTMLDPIADKAMVVIALACLLGLTAMNGWLVLPTAAILLREVFVSGLREFLGADAGKLAVTKLAKWKTTAQMVAIALLLLDQATGGLFALGVLALWIAAALTLLTGADYLRKAMPFLKAPQ